MTGERRYDEDEVREIFQAAAGPGASAGSDGPGDGMTLAELQEIGAEVGLSPVGITRAAAALDTRREALPRRKRLGLPVSVGRVVELPRAPEDREWDLLVGMLRETFRARGEVTEQGGIREWSNGNLHISVEPTADGHRLRLGTTNGAGLATNFIGVALGSLAVALAIGLAVAGRLAEDGPALLAMLGSLSAFALLSNVVRLPRWAREREDQMEEIADRAVELLSSELTPPESGSEP